MSRRRRRLLEPTFAGGNRGTSLLAATQSVADRATAVGSPLTTATKLLYNRAIARMQACGSWSLLTNIYIHGDTEAQWQINIKNPGVNDLVKNGSPTYTANTGATFSTVSDFYDTGVAYNTISQNSHCMMVNTFQATTSAEGICGALDGANGIAIYPRTTTPAIKLLSAGASNSTTTNTYENGEDWCGLDRSNSSNFDAYHNGWLVQNLTRTSAAASGSATITIGKVNGASNPGVGPVRGFYMGASMSAAQHQETCAALADLVESQVYGKPTIYPAGNGPTLVTVDVAVIGTTLPGIVGAYNLARLGASVALVGGAFEETIWDLGGMTVAGIGWVDDKVPSRWSGTIRDITAWIRTVHRSTTDGVTQANLSNGGRRWSMACRRMLDSTRSSGSLIPGQNIPVYMTGGISSITSSGARLTKINTADGRHITAKYVMECTDRGDVVYYSGVPYVTGREAAGSSFEANNGYLGSSAAKPHFSVDLTLDPYNTPGNSGSGRIADIAADPGLTTGAADPALQPMNYRLCVVATSSLKRSSNQLGTIQPSGYDATRYERIGRIFAAAPTYDWANFVTQSALEDGATIFDQNTGANFSTDLAGSGLSLANAGADLTAAAAVIADVRDYMLGLFYWIKNSGDARIPAGLRTSMLSYRMHAQEHLDPGSSGVPLNWPKRIYVREPIWMLKNSGFVLDGNDVTIADGGSPRSDKTVSEIRYRSDIHTIRNIDIGGSIYLEGSFNDTAAGGVNQYTPWPAEASMPDKANCENLWVATAPSMTKLAWASARMEQSLCGAAESGAHYIYYALTNGEIALQDVPYATIRTAIGANADVTTHLNLTQVN